jgi:DNA replication initiation complex subunit (GINS family)
MADMTLERLEDILKKEREGEGLADIGDDFFFSVTQLQERLSCGNDFFLQKKREAVGRVLREIVAVRANKVLAGKSDNASAEEHKLIKLLGQMTTNKAEIIEEMLSSSKEIEVRVVRSIPQFTGPDMKRYGPYESGQIVTLSQKISSLLLSHGYVEKVSET